MMSNAESEEEEDSSVLLSQPLLQPPPSAAASAVISANTLCTLARSDLRHDFKKLTPNLDVAAVGSFSIPDTAQCGEIIEDASLAHFLGIRRNPVDKTFIIPNAGPLHDDYYCIPKIAYTDLYEGGFKQVTPDGQIFLIVDTFTEGFREALNDLKLLPAIASGPMLYWVQNRQTMYDPATKSDPTTPAGREIMRNNPRVRFCWEDTSAPAFSSIEYYPSWNLSLTNAPVTIDSLPDKNVLFYSKNDTYLVLRSDPQNNYRTQESLCIMKTVNPVGNIHSTVIMSTEMASRTGVQFTAGTYSALTSSLYALLGMIGAQYATRLPPNDVQTTLEKHHYAAKRLGDQGQALSCLKAGQAMMYEEVIFQGGAPGDRKRRATNNLQRNNASNNNARPNVNISQPQPAAAKARRVFVPKKRYQPRIGRVDTNGINCFVTGDRLALCGAILYQAPVALFQYAYKGDRPPSENYAALFIRKNLLDEATQERLRREGLLSRIRILKEEINRTYLSTRTLVEELKSLIAAGRLSTLHEVYRSRLTELLQKNPIVENKLERRTLMVLGTARGERKIENTPDNREKIFRNWVIDLYQYVPTFIDITTRNKQAKERIAMQIRELQNHNINDRRFVVPRLNELDLKIRGVEEDPALVATPNMIALVNETHATLQAIEAEREKVRNLEAAIRSFKHTCDTLNEVAVGKLELCGGDVQNIKRSSFFMPGSYRTERPFIPKAACYTLSTYLYKIKEMIVELYPLEPSYLQSFLSVIKTCLTVVRQAEKPTGNLSKANLITTHLYDVIPELKPKPAAGGRRVSRRRRKGARAKTRKTRGSAYAQGPKAKQGAEPYIQTIRESIYKEMTIRTVCAILYAAYAYNDPSTIMVYGTTKKNTNNNDTERREITDLKGVLTALLMKLDPEEVDPKEDTASTVSGTRPNTETSYYYIPFIQEQITQIGQFYPRYRIGLQAMYSHLLQETDIDIPEDIMKLVAEFRSEKQTYQSFFPVPTQNLYTLPSDRDVKMTTGVTGSMVQELPLLSAATNLLSVLSAGGTVQSKKSRRRAAWKTRRHRR
jgi:hypothetical protein